MRVARVEVSYDVFLWHLRGHEMTAVETDLPADARIIAIYTEPDRRIAWLHVESATFDDVPELAEIPQFSPVMTLKTTEEAMLARLISEKCPRCGEKMAHGS